MVDRHSLLLPGQSYLTRLDRAAVAARLTKLASTSLSTYVNRRRKSVKPQRTLANRLWLQAKAARPSAGTLRNSAVGLAGAYGISRLIDRVASPAPSVDADGYPLAPHKYVSPAASMGNNVVNKYIGDKSMPFGYKNPTDYGKLYRVWNNLGYAGVADKQTPAYHDYKHLYAYANDPSSPLNARGKLLADRIKSMP